MNNLKHIWIALAAAPALTAGMAHADPSALFSGDQARYFAGNGGGTEAVAVIGAQVRPEDFAALAGLVGDITGIDCSQVTCFVGVDRNMGNSLFPTSTDPAEMQKAAVAIAAIKVAAPDAPVYFVDTLGKDQTNFQAAVTHLDVVSAKGFTSTYGIAPNLQTSITSYLDNHTDIVPACPAGFLATSRAVQAGGTEISAGTDIAWDGSPANDVASHAKGLVLPWGTEDHLEWAAGEILGALNQPGGMVDRNTLLSMSSSLFTPVSGGNYTLGVFKAQP